MDRVQLLALSFGLGIAAGLGFLFPALWFVSLAALGWWLYSLPRATTGLESLWCGWVFGSAKFLVVLSWFWSAYPATWLGLEAGSTHFLLVFAYWIPASLALGLGTGVFAAAYYYLRQTNIRHVYLLPLTAGVWVLSEVVGSYIFSVYTLGSDSVPNAGFSFGYVGYLLAPSELLLLLSAWGGVYLLSFFAVLFVLVVGVQVRVSRSVVLGAACVLCFVFPVPTATTAPVTEQILLVETRFAADSDLLPVERERIKFDLVKAALETDAETIILPEDFRFSSYFESEAAVFRYLNNITDTPVVLVDTMTVVTGGGKVLRAFIYDTKDASVTTFDKGYLVPQGEYIPYVYQRLLKLLDLPSETRSVLDSYDGYFTQKPQIPQTVATRVPPVMFCFESVTPIGAQKISADRAGVSYIAHPTSHAWFSHSQPLLWNQLTAMLNVQSVWVGLPILQSGNMVPAQVIAPRHEVLTETVASSTWWQLTMVSW